MKRRHWMLEIFHFIWYKNSRQFWRFLCLCFYNANEIEQNWSNIVKNQKLFSFLTAHSWTEGQILQQVVWMQHRKNKNALFTFMYLVLIKKDCDCKGPKLADIFTVSFIASMDRMTMETSAFLGAAKTIHLWRTRFGAVLSKITSWTSYIENICMLKNIDITKTLIILIFMFLAKIILY